MTIDVRLVRKGWMKLASGDVIAWVRGQTHLGDEYLDTVALVERFANVAVQGGVEGLDDLVSRLNGNWAAVVVCDDNVYLAVDHLRSIQLLYRQENDVLHVFDDMENFRKDHQLEFDEDCVHEYLSSGYVYGNRTLFKETYSLQAAERVVFVAGRIDARRYWCYIPNIDKPVVADDALVERIDKTCEAAIRRLVESVGGKRIVVPLSGGYDSRLIVNYLYKLGVKDVLCYTYGVKGNRESLRSREIAASLGYEWHYVEYTPQKWDWVLNHHVTDEYIRWTVNGVNRFHIQDSIAINELVERQYINPESDVIAPGYYFDYLAGSKVKKYIHCMFAASEMCEWENNFFPRHHFIKTITSIQKVFDANSDIGAKLFFEGWAWQERLAKFILNSLRVFEHSGFEWRLPLCDRDLFTVWLNMSYSLRYRRNYFRKIFPRLATTRIQNVPVFSGNEDNTLSKRVKGFLNGHIPYVIRYYARNALCRQIKYGGGELGRIDFEIDKMCEEISKMIPSTTSRLRSVGNTSVNCKLALKGLYVYFKH